tara:strand:- start:1095 stop:1355 length:261 start_codon:yes stop_codon:yes gene_type:complete
MVSSVREKINEVEKQKKIKRRLIKEGVIDAVEERQKSENNQPEHQEVEVREIPTETSSSDSIVESREEKVKTSKPKKKSKKASKKT